MIPNLQPNTTYAVHLRAASSSGGKDWIGSVTTNGQLHSYWGRTNQIHQHAAKPGDRTSLLKLVSQKQYGKDKYYVVDQYDSQQGWSSLTKQTVIQSHPQQKSEQQPQQPKPAAEPIVDWVEAPNESINWDF
jgi:hypothetical protein